MAGKELLFNERLKPSRELETPEGYRWFVFPEEMTGLRLVCLQDSETGVIVSTSLANIEKRVAAHRAWAGARHSRSPGEPWEIMHEMGERGVNPDEKLEAMFSSYGHSSVGDMASLQVDFSRVPLHLPLMWFHLSAINSCQEKSSRYQPKFSEAILHALRHYLSKTFPEKELAEVELEYQELGDLSLHYFEKHKGLITDAFVNFYQPEDEAQMKSLEARVLDCVRYFLVLGHSTGFSFETGARDWSRIIGEMKSSTLPFYQRTASLVEHLLSPTREEEEALSYLAEAPGLIRHTEANETVNENLRLLKLFMTEETRLLNEVGVNEDFRGRVEQRVELLPREYTEGERMIAQYLLLLWPGLDWKQTFRWVHGQDVRTKTIMSLIIFNGHTPYKELPYFARTAGMGLVKKVFLGELRDWNRHRGWSRFFSLPLVFGLPIDQSTARQILARGYGLPLYLSAIDEFSDLRRTFESDLNHYYENLYGFLGMMKERFGDKIDYSFVINLLPLAHQGDLMMYGDPKQAHYMPHLRIRPGGHINYRDLAWQDSQLLADADPTLEGLRVKKRPNPADRKEFFNRS